MNELHWRLLAHVTTPRCRRLVITYYVAVIMIVSNVVTNSNGFVMGRQSQDISRHIRVNV